MPKKSQNRTVGGIAGAVLGAVAGGIAGAMVGEASAKGKKPLKRAAEAIRTEITEGRSLETVQSLVGSASASKGTETQSTSGTKNAKSKRSGVKKKPTRRKSLKKGGGKSSPSVAKKRKSNRAPKQAKKKR